MSKGRLLLRGVGHDGSCAPALVVAFGLLLVADPQVLERIKDPTSQMILNDRNSQAAFLLACDSAQHTRT